MLNRKVRLLKEDFLLSKLQEVYLGKQLQDKCHELHTEGVFASFHKIQQLNETWDQIDHFTVSCLFAWALNESEAGGDLVLIETSLLFSC